MKKLILALLLCCSVIFAQMEEKEKFISASSLLLQAITVTIGGDFIVTGSFPSYKSQRLDYFITSIFNEAQKNALSSLNQISSIKQVTQELKKYPLRNITLKRADGEILNVDLLKFRLSGDFKNNPYLKNDDVIIFPFYDDEKGFIEINGAVNKPIKFQFVDGDNLSNAIEFAGGLNSAYQNINKAEVSRLNSTGNKEEIFIVDLNSDFKLKAGDRIRVLADENQKGDYKVLVLGEVKNPGFIYITRDSMTLRDVISKAGGFNLNADLSRAEVVRKYNANEVLKKYNIVDEYLNNNSEKLLLPETQLKFQQMKEALSMARLSNLNDEDTIFFNIDNQLRVLRNEKLVDFSKLNDPNSEESNFIIKSGDLILIPDHFDYVYVFGQVPKTGYIKYSRGKDYHYYIEKAGGLAESARDDEDVVIVKQKDMNWITKDKSKTIIEPGDFIYVPKEIPRTFWYSFSKVSAVISVIGSVATLILLLIKL